MEPVRIKITILLTFVLSQLLLSSPALGLTQHELVSGAGIWLNATMAIAIVFISAMAFSLQIARGYFIRILNKFTLRLGADIWWLTYVLLRDGLIFASFILGLLVFFPGTFHDYDIAVPFMPLAVVMFGSALVTKLYFDADDNRNAFRAVTLLVFAGTLLWIFGTVFITETPLVLSPIPSGISADNGFWAVMYNTFSSVKNINLAMVSFNVCFSLLGIIALVGLAHPIIHSRLPKVKKTAETVTPPAATSIISNAPRDTESNKS